MQSSPWGMRWASNLVLYLRNNNDPPPHLPQINAVLICKVVRNVFKCLAALKSTLVWDNGVGFYLSFDSPRFEIFLEKNNSKRNHLNKCSSVHFSLFRILFSEKIWLSYHFEILPNFYQRFKASCQGLFSHWKSNIFITNADGWKITKEGLFIFYLQVAKEIWVCENQTVTPWKGSILSYKADLKKKMLKDL